jgi:predicted glycogen debranching enzyme
LDGIGREIITAKRGVGLIRFEKTVCQDLEIASRREWLEANGLGGYASSTIIGLNTRRYHGLLVAATQPPVGRTVLLSKLEETLIIGNQSGSDSGSESFDLSVNQYPGTTHPQGHIHLTSFRLDPFPRFVYEASGVEIEKSVFMVHGQNTTVIEYEMRGLPRNCKLEIRPLIAFRDYHATTHENRALNRAIETDGDNLRITPYAGLPSLYLAHQGDIHDSGYWYRNFEYERECERGLEFHEDLFNPFTLILDFSRRRTHAVIASTSAIQLAAAEGLRNSEIERRRMIACSVPETQLTRKLALAADQFIVKREDNHTVIAGYPWFTDWGRDTMIALPGLTLSTGCPELTKSILRSFARSEDRGMVPNRFPDGGADPEYNTVDATLWLFEAVRAYLAHTGDSEFIRAELFDVLADIIRWHECGTRYGIRADEDGLLIAGEPDTQLTWMDAKIGDQVVTPRQGKPVEIQALWYNALRIMEQLCALLARGAPCRYREMAEEVKASFEKIFWNPANQCLYDVIDGEHRDASIRPNQILAVSLPHKMVSPEQAVLIVDTVEHHLLTPYGLRTLSPTDPHYRGRYEGNAEARDRAYHQGTVWPWLLGPFITAYLEVHGRSAKTRKRVAAWLSPLAEFMETEGVGQLPEIFDGDAPHLPRGCIAQAWSVAELLRVCVEEQSHSNLKKASRLECAAAGTLHQGKFSGIKP